MKRPSHLFLSVFALAPAALVTACGAEDPGACKVLCATGGGCPDGLSCASDGYCYGSDEMPGSCAMDPADGSIRADSAVDPIDGAVGVPDGAPDPDADPCESLSISGINETPTPIPDNDLAGVSSVIRIDDPCSIVVTSLQIRVDITHPFRGDIEISLDPPGFDYLVLQTPSNDAEDDIHVVFDRSAVAGQLAAGDWVLDVRDLTEVDEGTMTRWSIGLNEPAP